MPLNQIGVAYKGITLGGDRETLFAGYKKLS